MVPSYSAAKTRSFITVAPPRAIVLKDLIHRILPVAASIATSSPVPLLKSIVDESMEVGVQSVNMFTTGT
ncbi:MAG: hypothetical protein A4E50_00781 [Methanosaeta sp. PtaB.Bin087]|nr:MAG: hypothetical protein A4E50_00781 [Methanosaeta sp. PtaB.Bin087]